MTQPFVEPSDLAAEWEKLFNDFETMGVAEPVQAAPKGFTYPLPGEFTIQETLRPSPRPGMEK